MVKDHSDSERGNPLSQHWLLFSISSKGAFICIIPQQDNTYHGLCYTSRGGLAGKRMGGMLKQLLFSRHDKYSIRPHKIHYMWDRNNIQILKVPRNIDNTTSVLV